MIRVVGKKFYDKDKEILFQGIGIGTWLNLEHFMVGIPGCDFQIKRSLEDVYGKQTADLFYDRFVRKFVSEDDFRFLRDCGINLVRVPFNYRLFVDDRKTGEFKSEGFEYFDYLLDLAEKYQIYVLPDLHAVPGGQNPDWHSDNGTGYTLFWEYDLFRQQMVEMWKAIAAHCRDREYLLGYDILNEPFIIPDELDTSGEADPATGMKASRQDGRIADFYDRVTQAIRSVGDEHIIFLEGDHFASDFTALEGKIRDQQTALTFHFYPTVWYDNLYDDDCPEEERLYKFEEVFSGLIQIRERFERPVLCGEAGYDIVSNGLEKCMHLVDITMDLFSKYQVSFTLWCYKDACFMGMVYPNRDSSWMKLAEKIHEKWNHYAETKMADDALEYLLSAEYPQMTAEEKYLLSFRQRAVLYAPEQRYILKPLLEAMTAEELLELPDSFAFENCGVYQEYVSRYQKFRFAD